MSFNVSTIKDYVLANEKQLIGKAVVKGKTATLLTKQTGVKGSSYLNLLTTDPTLQTGSCGWNENGTTTVSRRKLETGRIKVNQAFCDKDLVGTALEYEVKVAVGDKTIPFEEDFINQNILGIQKKLEEIIWRGDVAGATSTAHLTLFDGFIKIGTTAAGVINATLGGTGDTLALNPKGAIDAIVANIPVEVLDKEDIYVFVGYEIYRKYVKALQDANLYHYTAELTSNLEMTIPGTNIKLTGVHGLSNQNKAYAFSLSNAFLGMDMANDEEKFLFWYSEDNSEYRLKVEFNAGVQFAYPDQVVAYLK